MVSSSRQRKDNTKYKISTWKTVIEFLEGLYRRWPEMTDESIGKVPYLSGKFWRCRGRQGRSGTISRHITVYKFSFIEGYNSQIFKKKSE